jgi:hypothetical protein
MARSFQLDAIDNPAVTATYAAYPPALRERLLELRALVLEVAEATPGVGRIEETLKWGQPSFLTPETGSGTTVRIDAHPAGGVALFVHCQTNLAATWRQHYPGLAYEGERAVVLRDGPVDEDALRHCVALALTYHQRKKPMATSR